MTFADVDAETDANDDAAALEMTEDEDACDIFVLWQARTTNGIREMLSF
jgi:hypothetical protein